MIEFAFYSAHSGKPPGNLDVSYDLNSTLKRSLWLLHGGWSVGRQGQRQGGEGEENWGGGMAGDGFQRGTSPCPEHPCLSSILHLRGLTYKEEHAL